MKEGEIYDTTETELYSKHWNDFRLFFTLVM
jgi:hypothetical protein